jgi:hypothetical protein
MTSNKIAYLNKIGLTNKQFNKKQKHTIIKNKSKANLLEETA